MSFDNATEQMNDTPDGGLRDAAEFARQVSARTSMTLTREQNDTPRTDEVESGQSAQSMVEHARQIERELAELQELMDDAQVLRKEYLARAETAERALQSAQAALAQKDERLSSMLREHYLRAIECEHPSSHDKLGYIAGRDKAHCSCSLIDLGWQASVGLAVEAWIAHFMNELAPAKGEQQTQTLTCPRP